MHLFDGLSWDKVSAIIRFLVERQEVLNTDYLEYQTEGDQNTVDLIGITEEGPNTFPAPHPYKRHTA